MKIEMKKKELETNGEILGAENREKVWEEFPDTLGETLFLSFRNFETRVFPILEKSLFPNPSKR